ncbi:Low-affinity putrescine importer PlaP [compost metagenome]
MIDLATLASLISFGALVAFSAVNLAVIRTHLISDTCQRNLAGLLRYGLIPLVGMSLTLWLWTSLSAMTLTIGLSWFALGLGYLMVLTGGFRRPVRTVNFSEVA